MFGNLVVWQVWVSQGWLGTRGTGLNDYGTHLDLLNDGWTCAGFFAIDTKLG